MHHDHLCQERFAPAVAGRRPAADLSHVLLALGALVILLWPAAGPRAATIEKSGADRAISGRTAADGKAAPDFTLPTISGANLRLQEQRGQVVMLNFWATWCGPCKREMPQLNRIYSKYHPAGFVLLGVNVDEDQANARGVATRLGVQFPVLFDTGQRVSRLYDLNTMPSTVIIDRDGRVRFVHRGYHEGTEDDYERQIGELLRE